MVGFGSFRNAVDDCAGFCTGYGVNHNPILLSDTESSDGLFRRIVMHRYFSILQEHLEVFFLIQAIVKPFPGFPFLGNFVDIFFQPHEIGLPQWADA